MTVIVAGHIEFEDPTNIPEVLTSARALVDGALSEEGCIAYSWTQDHLTPGRVWVYEEWTSSDTLEAHLNTDWYRNMGAHISAGGLKPPKDPIMKYRVNHQEPVYDDTGVARGYFFSADEQLPGTVIVAGCFDFVNADEVPDILTSARPHIEGALTEEGCVAYSWTEDHLTPGRVFVYEEWTSHEALEAHLNTDWYRNMGGHLGQFERKPMLKPVLKYRCDLQQPVYGEDFVARGHFDE